MSKKIKQGLVPKLRFPEFGEAGEWKAKRLSEIADLTSSKRVHVSDYVSRGIPFFRGKEISLLRENKMPEDILYISNEHYEEIKDKYGVPEVGDILITAVGTLGNVYCIKNSFKFYFKDGNLIWMKNISENSTFLEILLNAKRKEVLASAIGSSQRALTMVELNKLTFRFPLREEQQKIAACLTSLDELITAQSQKLDALKAHKKGLLQQLFPAEGERVPRLRFPEFREAGEWKPRNISEFAKVTTGNKDTQNKVDNGQYPFFVRSQNVERIDSYSYEGEAILTSGDGVGVGKNFHYIVGKFDFHQRVYSIYDFEQEVNGKFIYFYFSKHFYKRVMQLSAKNSVDSVRMAMISEMPVPIPSKKEQQKIAACLTSIDELITNLTQKIETLKAHKKGLMQQLFPSANENK